jgi:hypothetical protein
MEAACAPGVRDKSIVETVLSGANMADSQNKENVKTGQQGTNEPWKEPNEDDTGAPKSPSNVLDQEVKKKERGRISK